MTMNAKRPSLSRAAADLLPNFRFSPRLVYVRAESGGFFEVMFVFTMHFMQDELSLYN